MRHLMLAGFAAVALAGCAGGDRGLRDLRSSGPGPDEFTVMPVRPLTLPESFAELPPPTPGGANRTDPNPRADAIAALGGRPAAAFAGGIPASDSALVAAAGRHGTDPAIRTTLAEADAAFRARRATLTGSGEARYYAAYARQALDARAEAIRFRNAGVPVPSVPPAR